MPALRINVCPQTPHQQDQNHEHGSGRDLKLFESIN